MDRLIDVLLWVVNNRERVQRYGLVVVVVAVLAVCAFLLFAVVPGILEDVAHR